MATNEIPTFDVMVDIETLGTKPGSVILAIGACFFNAKTGKIGDSFYHTVDLKSAMDAGLTIDPSTIKGWMSQGDAARNAAMAGQRPLALALQDFSEWCLGRHYEDPNTEVGTSSLRTFRPENICMWANAATFDNVLLGAAYDAVGALQPWTYRGDRCYRTLKNLLPHVPLPSRDCMTWHAHEGVEHHALDDAIFQAIHCIALLQELERLKCLDAMMDALATSASREAAGLPPVVMFDGVRSEASSMDAVVSSLSVMAQDQHTRANEAERRLEAAYSLVKDAYFEGVQDGVDCGGVASISWQQCATRLFLDGLKETP